VLALLLLVLAIGIWASLMRMPGESYAGPEPDPGDSLEAQLRADIERLAGTIGERNVAYPKALAAAARWIQCELESVGYEPVRQEYEVAGVTCVNVSAQRDGDERIILLGAHYDSVEGSPGANDNASGVATVLALARAFAERKTARTLRFVFFVNEEPPWYRTEDMGSVRYAKACKERGERIEAMIALDTIGYFTDEPESQEYPVRGLHLAYGDKGNYLGFVGNIASRKLVRRAIGAFRSRAKIASHGIALMDAVPGIGWSDHWSFWQEGYRAIMVTDTAPFRYPHYHRSTDTPKQLRYDRLKLVVEGLEAVLEELAQ
jgi:hypothetical protein